MQIKIFRKVKCHVNFHEKIYGGSKSRFSISFLTLCTQIYITCLNVFYYVLTSKESYLTYKPSLVGINIKCIFNFWMLKLMIQKYIAVFENFHEYEYSYIFIWTDICIKIKEKSPFKWHFLLLFSCWYNLF